jgi:hypothetical protein
LIFESTAACFPLPSVPTPSPPMAFCSPLSIGNATVDGGHFYDWDSRAPSRAPGCGHAGESM